MHDGEPRRRTAPRTARARCTQTLWVADLHADSLLWGRDLLERATRGQVDVPRLIEGNVALQVLAATTKSPRHLNIERNDDRSDDVVLLALALGWPPATWRRLLPRALHLAARADDLAARSDGALPGHPLARRPRRLRGRAAPRPGLTAGLLAIEGAHALDGDPANVEVVADAGFRMMSPSHFFDNAFGGSAHGIEKGGLTDAGREMVERMEARGMLVDVAHASAATIDDILAMAGPAGRRIAHRVARRRRQQPEPDRRPRPRASPRPAACSGSGSGRPPAAVTMRPRSPGRSATPSTSPAIEHVGLGSDFDGAVPVPFDASGSVVLLTDALIDAGLPTMRSPR